MWPFHIDSREEVASFQIEPIMSAHAECTNHFWAYLHLTRGELEVMHRVLWSIRDVPCIQIAAHVYKQKACPGGRKDTGRPKFKECGIHIFVAHKRDLRTLYVFSIYQHTKSWGPRIEWYQCHYRHSSSNRHRIWKLDGRKYIYNIYMSSWKQTVVKGEGNSRRGSSLCWRIEWRALPSAFHTQPEGTEWLRSKQHGLTPNYLRIEEIIWRLLRQMKERERETHTHTRTHAHTHTRARARAQTLDIMKSPSLEGSKNRRNTMLNYLNNFWALKVFIIPDKPPFLVFLLFFH
jgi:hypothetical protein